MKSVGIAILGFGTVGGGTYNILAERKERIKEEYGVDITVKAIYVRNPKKAIANGAPQELVTSNFDDIITNSSIDIVAECIGGIEPAKTFLIESLKAGKNIVTANIGANLKSTHRRLRQVCILRQLVVVVFLLLEL